MKYIFAVLSFLLFIGCASRKNTSKITVFIDNSFTKESQMCYIHGFKSWISGNEFAIYDSAKIKRGQNKVRFKIKHPIEADVRLTFSKNGPNRPSRFSSFIVPPKSNLQVQVKPSLNSIDGYHLVISGKGSDAENEDITFRERCIDPVIKKMETLKDMDSVEYYTKQIVENSISMIKATNHPENAYSHFIVLRFGYGNHVGNDNLNKLKSLIKAKFPEAPYIQNLDKRTDPPSESSKLMSDRMSQIYKERELRFKQDTAIGAKLELSFSNLEGKLVSLSDVTSEYILVDFWASWCGPCQKEIPYLKEVLSKYKGKLNIIAVSIDRFPDAWKKGIKRDNSEDFIHLIGSDFEGLPNKAVQGLGIKSIPANFLLDKNHCIIAKNLRGERLLQVLDSLIQK